MWGDNLTGRQKQVTDSKHHPQINRDTSAQTKGLAPLLPMEGARSCTSGITVT